MVMANGRQAENDALPPLASAKPDRQKIFCSIKRLGKHMLDPCYPMKRILNIETDQESGTTEITIRVPGFRNFGQRLGELERKAFETPTDLTELVEVDKSTEEMLKMMDLGLEEMQKKIEAMPEGQDKLVMRSVLWTMRWAESEDDDEAEKGEDETPREDPFKYDLQQLRVSLADKMKWSKSAEAKVDRFLADWPEMRPAVLQATFGYYKEVYARWVQIHGNPTGGLKFTLPKPNTSEAVADLFCITTMYLHKNGNIGLGGRCTWDEEHGCGLLIKNRKVVSVGHEDEVWS
jgi:hypothetical protein